MAKAMKAANASALQGFESDVDELVRLDALKTNADAQIKALRETLDALAIEERKALEKKGIATKQVAFKGTGKDARYTFRDAYGALAAPVADDLRAMLGAHAYGALFESRTSYTMRPGVLDSLRALLGDQVGEYFDQVQTITPVEDFSEKRAALRASLAPAVNEALDHVIGQISQRPALSLK